MVERITVTIPADVQQALEELSQKEGVSPDEVVGRAVKQHVFLRQFHSLRERLSAKAKNQGIVTDQDANEAIALLESQMKIVTPKPLDQPVCRDPDDDQILATAIAAQAECIVTGDKDLQVLQRYRDIEIVSPSDFADFETKNDGDQP